MEIKGAERLMVFYTGAPKYLQTQLKQVHSLTVSSTTSYNLHYPYVLVLIRARYKERSRYMPQGICSASRVYFCASPITRLLQLSIQQWGRYGDLLAPAQGVGMLS